MSTTFSAITTTGHPIAHPAGYGDQHDLTLQARGVPFAPNFAISNALRVLDALGLLHDEHVNPDHTGAEPAETFLGRVLLAQAIAPVDEGLPATTDGNWHHYGRPVDHLQRALAELRILATWATAHHHHITWG